MKYAMRPIWAGMVWMLLAFCGVPTLAWAGVTADGTATGIPHVVTLQYDAAANRFTLNGAETVNNPVTRAELLDIISALRLDDRLGVSVKLNNELIVYGRLNKRSPVAKKMEDTDNFFRAIVFAEPALLKGRALPGNYTPKVARNRERASVIYFSLDDFSFFRNGTAYYPKEAKTSVLLIPMAKYTAPDGGYLPDYDALEKDEFQSEDKENTDHIQLNKEEYLKMEVVSNSIHIGEAAALVRFFRDCGINLEALAQSVESGDNKTLQGNPVSATPEDPVVSVPAVVPAKPVAPATPSIPDALSAPVTPAAPAEPAGSAVEAAAQSAAVNNPEGLRTISADNIRRVMALEARFGSGERVKLTRSAVNDGSYVAFRQKYMENLQKIDLTGCPDDFRNAFADYMKAWGATLRWLAEQKNITDGAEAFSAFGEAHAPFRKDLRNTYNECKRVAGEYGVKVE